MNKIKLFCFPYGGGSSATYYDWKNIVGSYIELLPIELAGRGKRIAERNYNSIDDAVEDVFNIVRSDLTNGAYALFGHSLGSMVAFELAYKIMQEKLPLPAHIFFSGRGAPDAAWHENEKFHLLPEKEFRSEIIKLGGIPREVFQEEELLDLVFSLLREDYKIAESYKYNSKEILLPCDITILASLDDEAIPEEIEAWKDHTSRKCDIVYFDGGHFFIKESKDQLIKIVNEKLRFYLTD